MSTDVLRLTLIMISLVQIALILKYYALNSKKTVKPNYEENRRFSVSFLLEICLHLLVLPPRVNLKMKFYQLGTSFTLSLSDIAFILTICRLYHLLRCIYHFSYYHSPRATFFA